MHSSFNKEAELLSREQLIILGLLGSKGIASSAELQSATGKSQATVSRLIAGLSSQVLTLGRARATLYGLPKSIHQLPAQQPIFWTDEAGRMDRIGTLSLLAGDVVHVESDRASGITTGTLPWFLSPLRAQGFLGRLLARRLESAGVDPNPERWGLESVLFAALQLHDAPGAVTIGEPDDGLAHSALPSSDAKLPVALEALARDVALTLPAGSSAGGEQPKFLARFERGAHVLVKFTPPRSTPFGERWHDLLHAEALASSVLRAHGAAVASTRLVHGESRTFLLSERFDRVGARGRRHAVPIGAVHEAFVPGRYEHWAASCESLARQRRLPAEDAAAAASLLRFGRLIGNTDMHSGNLSLFVRPEDLSRGRFRLAPVYDMLPMRWRPDPAAGQAQDYSPFAIAPASADSPADAPARAFWDLLSREQGVSRGLRRVAREMAARLSSSRRRA